MDGMYNARFTRRDMLKWSGGAAGLLAIGATGLTVTRGTAGGGNIYIEAFPTSPLVLDPFRADNVLPVPSASRPVPESVWRRWASPPGPDKPQDHLNDSLTDPHAFDAFVAKYGWKPGTHQVWPGRGATKGFPWLSTTPLVYEIPIRVGKHSFTTSQVQPIDSTGADITAPVGSGPQDLPAATIYGFNGAFPGARINAEYGRPVVLRLENQLGTLPNGCDRQDFGAPNYAFLTHLHNGHTAAESDGQPHYAAHRFEPFARHHERAAFEPGEWIDNLYLNYPAGGDSAEKQSFLWFHDHVHGHTGANVYKGMVGLYPIYDPYDGGFDMGDETKGLRLPGQRTDNGDGSFDVDYDLPIVLYDVRLDDGTTPHKDFHTGTGEVHPEWWGMHYFRHFPNHGFVGDIFTVNGTAFPVLTVKRRKYRLRFLGASISRIYQLSLMRSVNGPVASRRLRDAAGVLLTGDELQGQYRLPDGERVMDFMQIASEGGLLPHPIPRDSFEIWPAVRREMVVDFTQYANGTPTSKGDEIYLVNTMKMLTGRMWDAADPAYKVPMLKIVIGDDADDQSVMPKPSDALRPMPARRMSDAAITAAIASAASRGREFTLQRGSFTGQPETEWLINDLPFDATAPLASMKRGDADVWVIKNGGGGWVHPMHLHQEEHHVISRDGTPAPDGRHPDDTGKMDVVSLDPSETVPVYRSFRTFTGPYVAHCHNLAHEDHNMMFGWEILPAPGDPPVDQSPLVDGPAPAPGGGAGGGDAGGGGAGGGVAAVGVAGTSARHGSTERPDDNRRGRRGKKTVATLSSNVRRRNGRRIVRLEVSDSRRKSRQRVTIHIRHAGKDVSVLHRFLHKGHETFDIPLSRTLKGRYDIVVVLDDGTKVRRAITLR
jgi:FtsP/CotA-like multicopper oxidase with cupredoxin domain